MFLKEAKFKQVIPPVKIDDAEDITFEKATNALRRGVSFFSALQASDGHWPGEITGPLFFLPPLVFCLYITGHVGSEIALVKTGYLRSVISSSSFADWILGFSIRRVFHLGYRVFPILRPIKMKPTDRKGKGIAIDDGDETIASIARQTRSSARPERLLGGAIQADAAERRRKTVADEATAAADAERVVERDEMEEAARIAAEADRWEEAESEAEGRRRA
ncbi:unnamed protein product [Microthlaspi erraticum]|uniref:Squalene cyclase N-terminal domain-containing protein n=1 Tax=Microthlaspi erraticum TaxID=1685480 RepID=A0A6D2IVM3_9BRAS|nr:unnamed protein product [Microthlaspi erraticum]